MKVYFDARRRRRMVLKGLLEWSRRDTFVSPVELQTTEHDRGAIQRDLTGFKNLGYVESHKGLYILSEEGLEFAKAMAELWDKEEELNKRFGNYRLAYVGNSLQFSIKQ